MMVLKRLILGFININEWKRSISKLGILSISEDNLNKLFQMYDANKNNLLEYKELKLTLFPTQQTEQNEQTERVETMPLETDQRTSPTQSRAKTSQNRE